MNSSFFFVKNDTRNSGTVVFYLNDEKINNIFNSSSKDFESIKIKESQYKNLKPAIQKLKPAIQKMIKVKMADIKSEVDKDIQVLQKKLKNLESQDNVEIEYKILALFVILVIILYIISIWLIFTVLKISAKNEENKKYCQNSISNLSKKIIPSPSELNEKLTDLYNRFKVLEDEINSSSSSTYSSTKKEYSVPKNGKDSSTHSQTKKESFVSQSNHTPFSELSSYKTKKTDEFINEYHKSLSEGLEDMFIKKWNPVFVKIENIDDRKIQSDLSPVFKKPKHQQSADFWIIEFNKDKVIVPSNTLYKNMSALTSSRGRGSDAWLKGIFEIDKGNKYEIKKLAYYHIEKEGWWIKKGLLTLPILSDVPSTKSEKKFGFGRD